MITKSLRERLAEVLSKHDPFTVSRTPAANLYRSGPAELEWECSCEREPVPVASNEEGDAMSYGHLADVQLPVIAEWLRNFADDVDRGPTFPLPPSVISALIRERADSLSPDDLAAAPLGGYPTNTPDLEEHQ